MDTITVVTEDGSYEFTATGWMTSDICQLDVIGDDSGIVVASFAPTKWIGVYQNKAASQDT